MDTKKFRTRQEFHLAEHPRGKHYIIGLDAGYSAMKVFYENGYFCFPSYAKKLDEMLCFSNEKDILYKDMITGELYILGYTAQDMISETDTNDTEAELYSRKRYHNKKFRILCNAAIGIALMNKTDNREPLIQTGLPSSYVEADEGSMIKALSQRVQFQLKIGNGDWKTFDFQLKEENIFAKMPQPAGAFYSTLITNEGKYVSNAKDFLYGSSLVLDIGFGTFDFYGIKNQAKACIESLDEFGMKAVLKETSKQIMRQMEEEVRVPALQKVLESGVVTCFDEDEFRSDERPIAPLLSAANNKVFKDAMESAKAVTNSFRGYQYVIVSGGTGEAWFEKIQQFFSGMKSLKVIPANRNDGNPFIYSNVRGYYMYRFMIDR